MNDFGLIIGSPDYLDMMEALLREMGWSVSALSNLACGTSFGLFHKADAQTDPIHLNDGSVGYFIEGFEPDLDRQRASIRRRWSFPSTAQHYSQMLSASDGDVSGVFVDASTSRWALVRDRLGRIPVQFDTWHGHFAASTCPHFLESTCPARGVNTERMLDYVHLRDASSDTHDYLEGQQRVRPGELVWCSESTLVGGSVSRATYWTGVSTSGDSDFGDLLGSAIQRATNGKSSDFHLSAGMDSAALVASASRLRRVRRTHSLALPGFPAMDSPSRIREVAGRLGVRNSMWDGTEHWPGRSLRFYRDTPRGWGPIPHPGSSYQVEFHRACRSAGAEHEIVSGHGGNQLWHYAPRLFRDETDDRQAAQPVHQRLLAQLRGQLRERVGRWEALQLLRRSTPPVWLRSHTWLRPSDRGGDGLEGTFLESWSWEQSCRLVRFEERQSGLRMCFPYLDWRLWEAVWARLRAADSGARGKQLARILLKGTLPPDILKRPKTVHFDKFIEFGLGIRGYSRFRSLLARVGDASGIVANPRALDAAYLEYARAARARRPSSASLGSHPIWRTLSVLLWLDLSCDR